MTGANPYKKRTLHVTWEWESTPDARARLLAAYEMLMNDVQKDVYEEVPFDTNSTSAIMRHDESA